jgi:receptor protein-tyrosine kinase
MMDIERLFDNDRHVPGMRPGRTDSPQPGPTVAVEAVESPPGDLSSAADYEQVEDLEARTVPEFPITLVEPLRPGPQLVSAHAPGDAHSEKIRLLRTEIMLRHTAHHGAVAFAVIGASAGEGRSQLAAELALSFAQLGRSTLLLDADLRHPRQHQLFGTDLRDGLAQAIVHGHATSLFSVAGYPSLTLMTAGVCPANPIELLSDGRFESLLINLRSSYDFIVVDTPRCADYADGLVIATVVGHVLTVHRKDHTAYKAARLMFRQLASARAEVLGGVLNNF